MSDIVISEIFGPTIQGEGALAGRLTVFVRTGGCDSRCNWCVAPDTPILLADGSEKPARQMKVGDEVWGMARRVGVPETVGPYQVGRVEGVAKRTVPLVRVTFEDGRELVAAKGHAVTLFRSGRFRAVEQLQAGDNVRALLPCAPWKEDKEYKRGYLAGAADGDGSFHRKVQVGIWHFVIATGDPEILERFEKYARDFEFCLGRGQHLSGGQFAPARHIGCLRLTKSQRVLEFQRFLSAPAKSLSFWRGYMAGIYDTDGSTDGRTWSIGQFKPAIRTRIEKCLNALELDYSTSPTGFRLRGGLGISKRMAREVRPALQRKTRPFFTKRGGQREVGRVAKVETESLGEGEVVSIKTSLGTYIAGGVLSRNCDTLYAVLPEHKAEWTRMSAVRILERVEELSGGFPTLITASGGNPALQPLGELLELGHARGHTFALETQGTRAPSWLRDVDYVTISPKPPSSGMHFVPEQLARCVEEAGEAQVSLKVVVFDEQDYEFARNVWKMFPALPFFLSVGTSPSARSEGDMAGITTGIEWLIERASRDGWREATLLPQIHVLLWGQKRGV